MPAKYTVCLFDEQREHLDRLTRTGTGAARAIQHARILLVADEDADHGPAWSDEKVADALRVRKDAPGRPPKIDGTAEAPLIALACSEPPTGRARWTVRLLADRFVELGVEERWLDRPVSRETVRQTLKKTG